MTIMCRALLISVIICLAGLEVQGEDAAVYQFQMERVDLPNESRFYFFRYNSKTGAVENLRYDKPGGKKIDWYSVENERVGGGYGYILYRD